MNIRLALLLMLFFGSRSLAQPELNAPNEITDRMKYPRMDAIEAVYQPYLRNLSAYQPTYFLVGTDPRDSKFQFSFKYQLIGSEGTWAQTQPWVKGFHFGYTQTSFWDLKSSSAPFEDSSYKPELFYLTPNLDFGVPAIRGFFVRTGLQHESNGRGGTDSRSTNFAYIKPMFFFHSEERELGLMVAPQAWIYVNNDNDTNPDLSEYRGFGDLEIKFGRGDGLIMGNRIYWGNQGTSWIADLTYPLHKLFKGNLDLYLQVQYADTLAENLLNYQKRQRIWRIGLAIVR